MDPFSSLQVPDGSQPGPSRQHGARPVSVQPTSSTSPNSQSSATRKRASHNVVTSQPQQEEQPAYRDIYSHPAALEYAAAHPRRTIPKFGPYLLLQTLGEGEFGKVKLGLHMQWGEEVAVKLIRRGNIDSSVRMSKVEREIEVLRTLKHPNIVRLYDVIETDKYIGIILEYASGGELFDHILAHRYLREKDACKLFSQLISGVWYIHQKKIVHRDLKLENLLLDRHRNVIITDFGFANRFEHRADDLMQTSCGSPCYAAPELVISDGLYVGSAVDIWSCGVILYAMLAGYLPFDDDPANPDGDNINLLYKYIVNTPLSFPDYISEDARDLLSIMLVPDPARRADLPTIMAHRWLAPYAHLFEKSVAELERTAIEQHHQKRLAYQRQMKQAASAEVSASKMARSQSARTDTYASPGSSGSRSHREQRYAQQAQPEFLYETSAPTSGRRGVSSAIVLPTTSPLGLEDDPFAPSPSQEVPSISLPTGQGAAEMSNGVKDDRMQIDEVPKSAVPPPTAFAPVKTTSPESKRSKQPNRHTIQVEYGESESKPEVQRAHVNGSSASQERSARKQSLDIDRRASQKPLPGTPTSNTRAQETVAPAQPAPAPAATSPEPAPVVAIEVTGPPATPAATAEEKVAHYQNGSNGSTGSGSSKQSRHKKGLSIDKIGISKMFTSGSGGEQANAIGRSPSKDVPASVKDTGRRPSSVQVPSSTASVADTSADVSLLSPGGSVNGKKASRRNTLTVMVAGAMKPRSKKGTETPMKEKPDVSLQKSRTPEEVAAPAVPPKTEIVPPATPQVMRTGQDVAGGYPSSTWKGQRVPIPASTVKASKVMQWFRSKSKGRPDISDSEAEKVVPPADLERPTQRLMPSAPVTINTAAAQHLTTPGQEKLHSPLPLTATPSSDTSFAPHSFTDRVLKQFNGARVNLRVHHGAVDQTTITTGSPPEVMKHVKAVLEGMGIDIAIEHEYKYRCIRPKRKRAGLGLRDGSGSLAAFTMVGSAASNGVDKRGLPLPSQSNNSFSASTGGMLRGLLMRRQSSQVSTGTLHQVSPSLESEATSETVLAAAAPAVEVPSPISLETIYGDTQQDAGDEVRFSVELTRLDRLDDTYSLDIRRLKGNLRSYKFLYDTLRQRADLQR